MKHIYILLLAVGFVACEKSEKTSKPSADTTETTNKIVVDKQQFDGEKMQLGKLTEQSFNQKIKTSGMIDVPPQNIASISTFMGGYITQTPLLIGDKVKKGQILVTLENPEFVEIQQQYLEIAEQLNYLKSEFNRQHTLFKENITSQKNFLKAESLYKSALAQYNGLQKKLHLLNISPSSVEQGNLTSKINLYAPIDGFVTKINVSNGSYVSPADVVLELVDSEHIHIELLVFEKDILALKKDQTVYFKIPEASDKTFKAKVHLVGTTIDDTNRTVKVHAHIEDEEQANFIVGMFVEADIITHAEVQLALPRNAVVETENDVFGLVLENANTKTYTFKKVKLEVGNTTEKFVEILNFQELKDKDLLVEGAFMLLTE